MNRLLPLLLFSTLTLSAQSITWTDVSSSYALPPGVTLYAGTRSSPALSAWYLDVDMTNAALAVRPYLTSSPDNVPNLTTRFGAIASVNGGVFSGSQSLASVVYPNEVKAQNIAALSRNGLSYPVIRSFFGVDKSRNMHVDWVYHFDATVGGLYTFTAPFSYGLNDPTPRSSPSPSSGTPYPNLLVGIGGTPTLVKAGAVRIPFNEEIIWGSGIANDTAAGDPRTALGFTAQKHCILFVADGRGISGSSGLGLGELARVLINLGCVEAVNLDGGGSTQMAVGGTAVNGQSARAVPSIFSVIVADSLNLPKTPTFEKIIDTGDPECFVVGGGWFESANSGYYGTTKSKLVTTGDGSAYAVFRPTLPKTSTYTVYGWWVAASNRCTQTPFIVFHNHLIDTIRIDQTGNGSQWSPIGTYTFAAGSLDSVVVSNKSTSTGTYVVADAVRFVSYDPAITQVNSSGPRPGAFRLEQNFPNPFNPGTTIRYALLQRSRVRLTVCNTLGQQVAELVNGEKDAGSYEVTFNANGLASGVYLYRIQLGSFIQTKKLLLLR